MLLSGYCIYIADSLTVNIIPHSIMANAKTNKNPGVISLDVKGYHRTASLARDTGLSL